MIPFSLNENLTKNYIPKYIQIEIHFTKPFPGTRKKLVRISQG